MADNYLEKKMEEHRRSAPAPLSKRLSPLGRRRGTVCLEFGEKKIFVTGCAAAPDIATAVVKALADTGSLVAFVWNDLKAGRALAQSTSSRHYPYSPEKEADARGNFGAADIDVEISPQRVVLRASDGLPEAVIDKPSPSDVGELAVYLMLPLSRRLGVIKG